MADDDDYQPRTLERLIEILRAQSQNPRSWPNEAADALTEIRDALAGLVRAVVRDSNDPSKGISGYTSARLADAKTALRFSALAEDLNANSGMFAVSEALRIDPDAAP